MKREIDTATLTNIQALEMVIELEEFAGRKVHHPTPLENHDMSRFLNPLFKGKSFKARVANLMARPIVKVIKRTIVTDYFIRQRQVNLELKRELEVVRIQMKRLRDELRRSK